MTTQNGIFLFVPRSSVEKEFGIYDAIDTWIKHNLCESVSPIYGVLSDEADGWCVLIQHKMLPTYETEQLTMRFMLSTAKIKYPWLFKTNILYRRF